MDPRDPSLAVVGAALPTDSSLGLPDRVAGLRVGPELGRGAKSVVYRVTREDGTAFALKIMASGIGFDDAAVASFRREAALVAALDHPALPKIHEVGVWQDRPYLVMDLVEGCRLADLVGAGRLEPGPVIAIARDVLTGLAALHDHGLVHRDLKPENVIITPRGGARLIDFGLAARHSAWVTDEGDPADGATAVGTLAYAPPEQTGMLARPVDARSDLYSLGVLLFECLTGALPFSAHDVGELLRMHALTPPPNVHDLVPSVPSQLATVVATLLAKDPDDRYSHSAEVLAALADVERRSASPTGSDQAHADPAGADPTGADPTGPARPGKVSPLAGRATEFATVRQHWSEALGGHGSIVVVRGSAGVGKSRLAAEIVDRATSEGYPALVGKHSDDDRMPLAPLMQAIHGHLETRRRLPREQADLLTRRFEDAAGDAAAVLAGLSPVLARTLRRPASAAPESQEQVAAVVAGFLIDLARVWNGLVLHVDDVHWADPVTQHVLVRLSAEISAVPLLVLITTRDDAASTAAAEPLITALGSVVTADLRLGPLSAEDVPSLVASVFPGVVVDDRLSRLLAGRGKGNAFVTLQYLRAIVDAGLLLPDWGTWVLDEPALVALDLPHDVLGLILARIEGLGPESRRFLVTAAALGARFRPETVAAVHRRPLGEVQTVLSDLTGRGLVEPTEDARYTFVHDRVREALLDLTPQAAADLHQRIADTLYALPTPAAGHPPEQVLALARHAVLGRPDQDRDRAAAACRAAGQVALHQHDPVEAIGFLDHALDLLEAPDATTLLLLGTALSRSSQFGRAVSRLEQALDLAESPLLRAEILTVLAQCHRSVWNSVDADAAVAQALAELGAPLPRHPLRIVLSTLWMFVLSHVVRPLDIARADEDRVTRLRLIVELHLLGSYLGLTAMRPDLMLLYVLRGLFWVNRLGGGPQYVQLHGFYGFATGSSGLRRAARRAFARAQAIADTQAPVIQAFVAHVRGAAAYFSGADDGELWKLALRRYARWMESWALSDALASVFMNDILLGRTQEAQEWVQVARHRLTETADTTWFLVAPSLAPAASGRSGEAARADILLTESLDRLSSGNLALRSLAHVFVLREQQEVGPPLDAAIEDFLALGLPPAKLIRATRSILAVQALAVLEQCRLAPAADRPDRLDAARAAVARLEAVASTPTLRGFLTIARADLAHLRGDPRAALTILRGWDPAVGPDAPILAYEHARVTARARLALGHPGPASREVLLARSLTMVHGWPHRARWLDDEFGPAETTGTTSTSTASIGDSSPGALPTRISSEVDRRRLHALEELGAAASHTLDPASLARTALDELIRILSADRALLFLADETDSTVLSLHTGRDAQGQDLPSVTDFAHSLVDRVRQSREPLIVTGTEQGAALGAQSVVLHDLRSVLVAPLQLDQRLLGVVYLDSRVAKGVFTPEDVATLTAVTAYIAASLETTRAAQLEIAARTAHHQRELAEQAHEMERQLAQTSRLESIGRLASGIAHEINTPLQFLTANAEFLVEATTTMLDALGRLQAAAAEPAAERVALLEEVLASADLEFLADEVPTALTESRQGLGRVSEIVRAMKDYARPGGDRGRADVNRAIETTVQVCRNEWKHVAVVRVEQDPGTSLVPGNEGDLKQVLLNLIVNAAQAIAALPPDRGEPRGTIAITTQRCEDEFLISVSDDGIGMDDEVQAQAFDPFFTTREVGQGRGQGLSQVHSMIVSRLQGRVTLESVPGKGTTVTVVLPLRSATTSATDQ